MTYTCMLLQSKVGRNVSNFNFKVKVLFAVSEAKNLVVHRNTMSNWFMIFFMPALNLPNCHCIHKQWEYYSLQLKL